MGAEDWRLEGLTLDTAQEEVDARIVLAYNAD